MPSHRLVAAAAFAVAVVLAPTTVLAHGFGERYDLPVPLDYFLIGAAAAVALSFVVIGLFVQRQPTADRYPRFNLLGPSWSRRILTGVVLPVPARAAVAAVHAVLGASLGVALLVGDGDRADGVLTAGFAAALLLAPPVAAAVVTGKVVTAPLKALSVTLFAIVVAAAFFGTDKPIENLAPTFVWIGWWVGLGYAVALLGNVWALINPWKIVYEWAEKLLGVEDSGPDADADRYPTDWELWPAAILFLIFAWLENVYSDSSIPLNLGMLIVLYSIVTWAGMVAFGKHRWLARGEAFTVLFGLFSRFSPTEARVTDDALCGDCTLDCDSAGDGCVDCYQCFERAVDAGQGELNVRPYAVGLASPVRMTTAAGAFVIIALASVTFDGLTATEIWTTVVTESYGAVTDIFGPSALEVINTAGLVLLPLLFVGVYLLVVTGVRLLSRDRGSNLDVAKTFVLSLVPIALAYNLAHFISLLAIQGQNLIPLASDPFGVGWDLFGTLSYRIDTGVIGPQLVWFVSVAAIVIGHIISVYVAHVIAARRTVDRSLALKGQYPMLALMVFYTTTSLWIIAQPIASEG